MKDWNPKLPEMPVDKDGNWIDFPGYGQHGWEVVHAPFHAYMTIDGMRTGRSSKKVILVDDKTGKQYPMFVADLVKAIQNSTITIEAGVLSGWWTGSKRGANYGIKPTEEP